MCTKWVKLADQNRLSAKNPAPRPLPRWHITCAWKNIKESNEKSLLDSGWERELEIFAEGGERFETAGLDESGAWHLAHAIAFRFTTALSGRFRSSMGGLHLWVLHCSHFIRTPFFTHQWRNLNYRLDCHRRRNPHVHQSPLVQLLRYYFGNGE